MENREFVKEKASKSREVKINKRELISESVGAIGFFALSFLLGTRKMVFDTYPLLFALLAAGGRQTPFILIGSVASAFLGIKISLMKIVGACTVVALRIIARLYLDKTSSEQSSRASESSVLALLFSEHTYLRIMSGALGVFVLGLWRIVEGGFRFYDLFASIFYLILTPIAAWIFSWYFNFSERRKREGRVFSATPMQERMYDISRLALSCALVFALDDASALGVSLPVLVATFLTLYACKRGALCGIFAGLLLGVSYAPIYAPAFAFCAIAYASLRKLSIFGGAVAACISALIWTVYTGGIMTVGTVFPALMAASMTFCTAEKINVLEDIESFFEGGASFDDSYPIKSVIGDQKSDLQKEKIRSISDSFSALSEVFYNLSSKLKRPTVLDLKSICEHSFERHCEECDGRELCFGAEYDYTLEIMKKITLQLHTSGVADESKLPEEFRKRCNRLSHICEDANRSCAIATKKAFLNEKTEIFAIDYDAISKILNDTISENEEEFEINAPMSKKIALAIAEEGYGDRDVTVFGKRKLKIFARGLDLTDRGADVSALRTRLEEITRSSLSEPTFELAFGSVNMHLESKRAFSADAAFATVACEGEGVCGDTVSVFENKNDYLYSLISDGMGAGNAAALASETCNVFLRNMLTAGNKMETSLRMLNSVLRARGSKSENECSATVDLLQLDLYSGALTLVKSGAAPTFVIRKGNVFKLASPSLPIGILRALDAKQLDISCEDGDVVVMVSDGATRDGDDCSYLAQMLKEDELVNESARKIADKILRRAKSEIDAPNDDISVVVIKIKRDVCNW